MLELNALVSYQSLRHIHKSSRMTSKFTSISESSKLCILPMEGYCDEGPFSTRSHLCGYELELKYPQQGHFPTIRPPIPSTSTPVDTKARAVRRTQFNEAIRSNVFPGRDRASEGGFSIRPPLRTQKARGRDLWGRPEGTIDTTYGCNLYDEMIDYALNFSIPWRRCLLLAAPSH